MKNLVDEKIKQIRYFMKENKITTYMITLSDFHNSEYPCEYFKGIEYISGFTGSSGTLIIDMNSSYLWTDGRYFIQCENEISGSEIKMMKMAIEGYPSTFEFIEKNLKEGDVFGFDGRTVSFEDYRKFLEISKRNKFEIKMDLDILEKIWKDRPELPKKPAFLLEEKFSGESFGEKIKKIRKIMEEKEVDIHILSTLDDIAWLLNLRGDDIKYNPFVMSYLVILKDKVLLFADNFKFSNEIKEYFNKNSIVLYEYFKFYNYLKDIDENKKILLDYNNVNSLIVKNLNKNIMIINSENPTILLKAIKNSIELENTRNCHIKDGIAITKFMYWLKNQNFEEKDIKELDAVEMVEKYRREQKGYLGNNFSTISAHGKNSAMMHYLPSEKSNDRLRNGSFLLVDSGGHYYEGSTDITRTFAIGKVSEEMKKHYTYVLKSLISLSKLKFPKGTTCGNLDTVARSVIWNLGFDYRCATGHGVGYLGGVHEEPNVLRGKSQVVMEKNMVTTIEPGIYLENKYGIRLENEVISKKIFENEYGEYLDFETITLVPFDSDAIIYEYLDESEKEWLKKYNDKIINKIGNCLEIEEKEWLKKTICKF